MSGERIDISGRIALDDQASPTIRKIQASIQRLTATAAKVGGSFRRFANMGAFGGVAQNAKNAAAAVGRLGSSLFRVLGPVAALAGVAGFAGITAEMQNYIRTTDEAYKASQRLGIGFQQYQQLSYAADLAGASMETVSKAVSTLQKNMNAAVASKKPTELSEGFARLGISMRDSNGRLRNAVDILPQVANAMKANTSQAARAQIGNAFFGKSWRELIPLLQAGGPELMKSMQAMLKHGVITDEAGKAAEEAADAQTDLGYAISGVKNAIMGQLLPSMTPAIRTMTEWVDANRAWIATGFQDFLAGVSEGMQQIPWDTITAGLKAMGTAFKAVWDAIGGFKTVIPVLAGLLGVVLVKAISAAVIALGSLSAALLTNPIFLLIAAIGLLAYAMWSNWAEIVQAWDSGVKTVLATGQRLAAGFVELWDNIKAAFWTALGWLDEFVGLFIPGSLTGAWAGVQTVFEGMWNGIKAAFASAWAFIEPIIDAFMAAVGPLVAAAGKVVGVLSGVGGAVAEAAKGALNWITGGQPEPGATPAAPGIPGTAAAPLPAYMAPAAQQAAPGPLSPATTGPTVRAVPLEGEVKTNIHVTAAPGLNVTATTSDKGQVSSTVDVGRSMVPAT